jgi:hypothetical protein
MVCTCLLRGISSYGVWKHIKIIPIYVMVVFCIEAVQYHMCDADSNKYLCGSAAMRRIHRLLGSHHWGLHDTQEQ